MSLDARTRRWLGLIALFGPVALWLAIVLGPGLLHAVVVVFWWAAFFHAAILMMGMAAGRFLGMPWLSARLMQELVAMEVRAARWTYHAAREAVCQLSSSVAQHPPALTMPPLVPEAFALRRERSAGTTIEVYRNYARVEEACIAATWMALVEPADGETTLAIVHNNATIATVRCRQAGATTVDTGQGEWSLIGDYDAVCQQLGDILRALGDVRGFTAGVSSETR